ncbi:unnamed protein product [Danaus chrysippus]|uniref:(African queen) hypothetical protein n=1 Tax=Danaus chrysippus TaxID=151541 RepID=A0A8J2W7F3_9NEOP|nr:unnamed protein product [Danaus chrysippus]
MRLPDLSDVSANNISTLPTDALLPAAGLRDLNLSANLLEVWSPSSLASSSVTRLWLDRCGLARLPPLSMPRLHHLQSTGGEDTHATSDKGRGQMQMRVERVEVALQHYYYKDALSVDEGGPEGVEDHGSVEDNLISDLSKSSLSDCRNLRVLRLSRNKLPEVPTAALATLTRLQALYEPLERQQGVCGGWRGGERGDKGGGGPVRARLRPPVKVIGSATRRRSE